MQRGGVGNRGECGQAVGEVGGDECIAAASIGSVANAPPAPEENCQADKLPNSLRGRT